MRLIAKQTGLSNRHAKQEATVILNMLYLILILIFGASICEVAKATENVASVEAQKIITDSKKYDGNYVLIRGCVNATFHDITLVACGSNDPQINIEKYEASHAYERLVDFAHQHMGDEPERLQAIVGGVYRFECSSDGCKRYLSVATFKHM